MRPSNLSRSHGGTDNSDPERHTDSNPSVGRRGESCEVEHFRITGLPEIHPVISTCESINEGHVDVEELEEADKVKVVAAFVRYRNSNPKDPKAQKVDPDDLKEVAKFLISLKDLVEKFYKYERENPNNEVLMKVDRNNLSEIITFTRDNLKAIR